MCHHYLLSIFHFEIKKNCKLLNSGNLYLKVYNSSLFQSEIWKVNNGGTSAAKLTNYPGGSVNDIKLVGANIYVASSTAIGKSTDGGTSWSSVTPPPSASNISKIYLYDNSNIIVQMSA